MIGELLWRRRKSLFFSIAFGGEDAPPTITRLLQYEVGLHRAKQAQTDIRFAAHEIDGSVGDEDRQVKGGVARFHNRHQIHLGRREGRNAGQADKTRDILFAGANGVGGPRSGVSHLMSRRQHTASVSRNGEFATASNDERRAHGVLESGEPPADS